MDRFRALVPVAALASAACAARTRPCSAPEACGAGQACVLGACAAAGALPVSADARRIVALPDALALVSSRGPDAGDASPMVASFGARACGSTALLMRFPAPWGARARIERAVLVLWPAESEMPASAPVRVGVARVLGPWSPAAVTWERLPALSPLEATADATGGPGRPLRIDVTALVDRWARRAGDDFGLALVSEPAGAFGASYALVGRGPSLEVYAR